MYNLDNNKRLTPNLSVVADVTPAVFVKYVVTLQNFLEQFALIFVVERFVATQAETQMIRQARTFVSRGHCASILMTLQVNIA